jgi:hypothetical protein
MKWLVYLALLLAAWLIPVERVDIGELCPIEVIAMTYDGTNVILQTDTGDMGKGATAEAAARNMEETTAGILYLDTAQYLLTEDAAVQWVDELRKYLKGTIKVYTETDVTDLMGAAEYLDIHGENGNGRIVQRNGRFIMEK